MPNLLLQHNSMDSLVTQAKIDFNRNTLGEKSINQGWANKKRLPKVRLELLW